MSSGATGKTPLHTRTQPREHRPDDEDDLLHALCVGGREADAGGCAALVDGLWWGGRGGSALADSSRAGAAAAAAAAGPQDATPPPARTCSTAMTLPRASLSGAARSECVRYPVTRSKRRSKRSSAYASGTLTRVPVRAHDPTTECSVIGTRISRTLTPPGPVRGTPA